MDAWPPGFSHAAWRRNLTFIWIGVFTGLLGTSFVFPFIPFYLRELGVEDDGDVALLAGLTASATGLSLTISAPLWGSLADRLGRKPMFIRALVGAGITVGLMGAVQVVWQLVALRFLMGAFAGTMAAAAALVAATTPRARVGYALGALQTAVFSANMLGPVLGGLVAASLGLRESFYFCSGLFALAVVLGLAFVHEPPGAIPPPVAGERRPGLFENLSAVVAERQVVVMMAFLFCMWLSTTFVRPVMPLSIENFGEDGANDTVAFSLAGWRADLEPELATGIVFGVLGATSTIAALSVAPLGQRLGYRNCVAGAALFAGLLHIPVALACSFGAYVAFFGAVGLFQGAMVPGTNALIAASAPEGKHGSAFGLAASMQSLALLLGPLAGGLTATLLGIESVYIAIAGVLGVAATGAMLLIREPRGLGR